MDHDLTALELDAINAVVTEATVGIARRRDVCSTVRGAGRSLVPDRHVCIVRADQIVADVPDAVALLEPPLRLDQQHRRRRHWAGTGSGNHGPRELT